MEEIEIYNKNGKHIGYGRKNSSGDYDYIDDHGNYIGTFVSSGFAAIYELYDRGGHRLGYIDDPSLGFSELHEEK